MIACSNVSKRYPQGPEALKEVSFEIEAGEMVFITGHSGAGKSTLFRLLAAIERPTSGSIVVNGQNLAALRKSAIPYLRRNFGLIFQDQKLLFDRSVLDNVLLPLAIVGAPRKEALRRARAALDKVGLLEREKAHPIALSGGEQQRLCIARAVVHQPSLLIADEPSANLDRAYALDIMELFRSFHQAGTTVLIAAHDETLMADYGHRILRLREGRFAA